MTTARPAATVPPQPSAAQAASSSQRVAPIVGIVALFVVLGAGGYFGYRMLFGGVAQDRVASVDTRKVDRDAPANAAKDVSTAAQSEPGQRSVPVLPAVAAALSGEEAKSVPLSTPTPAEAAKLSAPEGASGRALPGPGVPGAATKKASSNIATPPLEPAPAPATKPTPPAKLAAAAHAVIEPARTDRWQVLNDTLAHCAGENFLARVVCEHRERLRYCEGYWGHVPQCSAEQPKEHAQ